MTRLLIFLAGLACGLLAARVRRAVGVVRRKQPRYVLQDGGYYGG